ncbi:MAG: hypothetical protein NTW86_13510 [Candidatus Sumerlaeota bacterium]|nr:hypothetical protein [Candidatus Sumerlaeota bacterium]
MGFGDIFKSKKKTAADLEKKIQLCKGYAALWREFFEKYFADSLQNAKITEEQEAAFFKTMTVLANRHFEFVSKMGEDLKGGDKLLSFLGEVVSLAHLQAMSEAEFSATQVRWHELFIELNKTLGRLLQRMPVTTEPARPAAEAKPAKA